ncbi:Asp/Glu/hydantoin racemase [Tricharina praecox]|uniref:Asp/Glu/hydantoin racemase n=1 Tax=Tricharina praecox TaxID=43433 RepID=UPI00221EE9E2|nr:Asp/Glu/hydantoin racemase [Tricharina praecox]KAI5854880.1 Asp/Glu/hydantoin racemase [Tricharina praecox]
MTALHPTPSTPSTAIPRSLLIINPNSTTAMTTALVPIITPLLPPSFRATYFTGPPSSPPSINNEADSTASATACLPLLLPLLASHDAVLIACYSAHPLVPQLRARTAAPVIGILEASVYFSLALLGASGAAGGKFGIVTTGAAWESLLATAVEELLGGKGRFAGVTSTGLDADQLHRVGREELEARMGEATRKLVGEGEEGKEGAQGAEVVCLGCAGMVGLREVVEQAAKEVGKSVKVVDGVEAGVGVLVGMVGRY